MKTGSAVPKVTWGLFSCVGTRMQDAGMCQPMGWHLPLELPPGISRKGERVVAPPCGHFYWRMDNFPEPLVQNRQNKEGAGVALQNKGPGP